MRPAVCSHGPEPCAWEVVQRVSIGYIMTNNTPNKPAHQPSVGGAAGHRRRRALQAFMDRLGMTAADLARTLGLSTANAIYNHLNGRSGSLSLPIIEAILDHFHGLTFEELTGRKPLPLSGTLPGSEHDIQQTVGVTLEAVAGLWHPAEGNSPPGVAALALPPHAAQLGAKPFAILVGTPGAEAAYPAGTLLACRRLEPGERLQPGLRVVVRRFIGQQAETTIREVAVQQGETWLMSLSTHPEHQTSVQVASSARQRPRHEGPGFRIEGAVAWAWAPQPCIGVPQT